MGEAPASSPPASAGSLNRTWRRVAKGLAAALALVLPFLLFKDGDLPSHRGRDIDDWFRQYSGEGSDTSLDLVQREEARLAIKAIGEDDVPYLVGRTRASFLERASYRISSWWNSRRPGWKPPGFEPNIWLEAKTALLEIRPSADVLLPHLLPALKGSDANALRSALLLLECIGENAQPATPHLRAALTGTDFVTARMAMQSVAGMIAPDPGLTPDIVRYHRANLGSGRAMIALGSFGPAASNALPLLHAQFLSLPATNALKISVAAAICQISFGGDQAHSFLLKTAMTNSALPLLLNNLKGDRDFLLPILESAIRHNATNSMPGSRKYSLHPALWLMTKISHDSTSSLTKELLEREHELKDPLTLAIAALEADPENKRAAEVLLAGARGQTEWRNRQGAIWGLQHASPTLTNVVVYLEGLYKNPTAIQSLGMIRLRAENEE